MAGRRRERTTIIGSVAKALAILDYLSLHGEAGVTEIAGELTIHKSTVSRMLATMEAKGYVRRNEANGKYGLGMYLLKLAGRCLEEIDLRHRARPFLAELVRLTGETAHLGILDRGEIVYIDKVDTPQTLMMRSRIGARVHAHCTALGKAILAALPEETVDEIIREKGLPRFTPNTITDPSVLKDHLRLVRRRGFALDDEEYEEGIRCAGAAVLDHTGSVVAALSVSGPTIRITRQKLTTIGELVGESAARLSTSLGYHPGRKED